MSAFFILARLNANTMRQIFRQYFIFSDNERRAVICLSALAFVLFLLPYFLKQFRSDQSIFDESLQTKIVAFNENYASQKSDILPPKTESLF